MLRAGRRRPYRRALDAVWSVRPYSDPMHATRTEGDTSRMSAWRRKLTVEERYIPDAERRALYTGAVIVALVGAAIFTTMLVGVLTGGGAALLDDPVRQWILTLRDAQETSVMAVLAFVFGPVAMPVIVLVVGVAWAIFATHAWRPFLLWCGMGVGVVTALTMAPIVQHPRPPVEEMLLHVDRTFSFPSGHVLGACDFLLITAFLIASRERRTWVRVALLVLAVAGIVTQIYSRLYLGYHWLTDVLGSLGISLMILGLVIAVDTWRTARISGEPVTGELSSVQRDGT